MPVSLTDSDSRTMLIAFNVLAWIYLALLGSSMALSMPSIALLAMGTMDYYNDFSTAAPKGTWYSFWDDHVPRRFDWPCLRPRVRKTPRRLLSRKEWSSQSYSIWCSSWFSSLWWQGIRRVWCVCATSFHRCSSWFCSSIFNTSAFRIEVEHDIGHIYTQCALLQREMALATENPDLWFQAAVLMHNIHSCIYRNNQTYLRFKCRLPALRVYMCR